VNQNRKWLIGIGVVAALCLCAGAVVVLLLRAASQRLAQSVSADPTTVTEMSRRIAEFDVPPGYTAGMAMSILVYDVVSLVPDPDSRYDTVILLMQYTGPGMADPEEMQQVMEQQVGQSQSSMTVVETRRDTIRGQEVVISVSEGTAEGYTMRQWLTVFEGNAGPTMLMIQGTTFRWDEELVTDFIHSIR
jgi:hypothetical protein